MSNKACQRSPPSNPGPPRPDPKEFSEVSSFFDFAFQNVSWDSNVLRQLTGRYYQSKYIERKDNVALRNFWYWYHNPLIIQDLIILNEALVPSADTPRAYPIRACHI